MSSKIVPWLIAISLACFAIAAGYQFGKPNRNYEFDKIDMVSASSEVVMWQGMMSAMWSGISNENNHFTVAQSISMHDTIKIVQAECYRAVDDWTKAAKNYPGTDELLRIAKPVHKKDCEQWNVIK